MSQTTPTINLWADDENERFRWARQFCARWPAMTRLGTEL